MLQRGSGVQGDLTVTGGEKKLSGQRTHRRWFSAESQLLLVGAKRAAARGRSGRRGGAGALLGRGSGVAVRRGRRTAARVLCAAERGEALARVAGWRR